MLTLSQTCADENLQQELQHRDFHIGCRDGLDRGIMMRMGPLVYAIEALISIGIGTVAVLPVQAENRSDVIVDLQAPATEAPATARNLTLVTGGVTEDWRQVSLPSQAEHVIFFGEGGDIPATLSVRLEGIRGVRRVTLEEIEIDGLEFLTPFESLAAISITGSTVNGIDALKQMPALQEIKLALSTIGCCLDDDLLAPVTHLSLDQGTFLDPDVGPVVNRWLGGQLSASETRTLTIGGDY